MPNSHENSSAADLVDVVIRQGFVDSKAVSDLERHFRMNSVIDPEEANLLFAIQQAVRTSQENCPNWNRLFADCITRFVVFDMGSPGELSSAEARWLCSHLAHLQPPTELSEAERLLLSELKRHSTTNCPEMNQLLSLV